MILFFKAITVIELIALIPGSNLDYNDLNYNAINLSELPRGQVFY
jgi:hypothetical protein